MYLLWSRRGRGPCPSCKIFHDRIKDSLACSTLRPYLHRRHGMLEHKHSPDQKQNLYTFTFLSMAFLAFSYARSTDAGAPSFPPFFTFTSLETMVLSVFFDKIYNVLEKVKILQTNRSKINQN